LKTKFGLPLANADNILEIVRSSGIANWKITADPIPVEDYPEINLTNQEIEIKRKFQVKVSQFLSPSGENFRGFLVSSMSGARVFTLLEEGLVPICAEFQHACGEVFFDLPGGILEPGEDPAVCAKREFEEESGIVLENVISLSSVGMPIAAKRFKTRNFSFIGIARNPVTLISQKLDAGEHLKTVLVSLDDWLKLIDREMVQAYSASTTLLALRRLGMVSLANYFDSSNLI
jgi:ADP-ribose pyrophosphatase